MERVIRQAIDKALEKLGVSETPEYVIEKPKDPAHGDRATNAAFLLARVLRKKPADIASDIAAAIGTDTPYISSVEPAPNGFINFRIDPAWNIDQLADIQKCGEAYGRGESLKGHKVVVEFVSSNPTGPLTIGHGRQAVLGDCICNLLEAAAADVTREYYYNDSGNQMNILGRSLRARYAQLADPAFPLPENCYQGEYLVDIAREFRQEHGDNLMPKTEDEALPEEKLKIFREFAAEHIRRIIDRNLKDFRIGFDVWSLESALYREGKIQELLDLLKEKSLSYEKENATWLSTQQFGDTEDRVVVKSTGEPTYFLPDLAYHMEKHNRGFDEAINIHGADHHGYTGRMLAGLKALGYPENWLRYVIHQMVSFKEGDEEIKMSTRAGKFITLADLCKEVGVDVARYFFVMRKADSHLVFDLDLAREQSNENPVYYCQYVHARICSVEPTAAEAGVWNGDRTFFKTYKPSRLEQDVEQEIIIHLIEFPSLVEGAAHALEPHRLTYYLEELAKKFHAWYHHHRFVTEDKELSLDRLYLADCVRTVIANGLRMLGITAPEKM